MPPSAPGPVPSPAGEREFLPLVISVPHGGKATPPGVSERVRRAASTDSKLSDLHTHELAMAIDKHITACTGKVPFLVVAKFHRKYIDANRKPEENAFNTEDSESEGRAVFEEYHELIRTCVEQAKGVANFGQRVLLLDIHGCKHNESHMSLILGTRQGQSYDRAYQRSEGIGFEWHLRHIFNLPSMFHILPEIGEPDIGKYTGGYTAAAYHSPATTDAIQIEFNQRVRHCRMARGRCALLLAEAYVRSHQGAVAEHAAAAVAAGAGRPGSRSQSEGGGEGVVFLDIVGVLCVPATQTARVWAAGLDDPDFVHDPSGVLPPLHLRCLLNLKYLIERSGAKIVLSSTWRLDDTLTEFFKFALERVGIDDHTVIGQTPALDGGRGQEIRAWLQEHIGLWKSYVIIGDSNEVGIREALPDPYTNLVRTSFQTAVAVELDKSSATTTTATDSHSGSGGSSSSNMQQVCASQALPSEDDGLTDANVEEAILVLEKAVADTDIFRE
jgi:N-formylglutamate amidohydrolase